MTIVRKGSARTVGCSLLTRLSRSVAWPARIASVIVSLALACARNDRAAIERMQQRVELPPAGRADTHLLVLVRSEAGTFSLLRITGVPGQLPKRRGNVGPSEWTYRALSEEGVVLHTESMGDPHAVHGSFTDPTTGEASGVVRRQDGVAFGVRVPFWTAQVQFFEGSPPDVQGAASINTSGLPLKMIGAITIPK